MRISLSVVVGALFSFFLLVAMTRLVTITDLPVQSRPRTVDNDVVVPSQSPVKAPKLSILPKVPQTPAMPKPPGTTIDVDENGTTLVAVPPGTGKPGVIDGDPTVTRFVPGKFVPENGDEMSTTALQPLQQVPPLYPRELAARGIEGWVTLTFDVRQDGTVGNIRIRDAKPRGAFDEAARKAVQRWRYQSGLSSPAEQSVTLNFTLEN